MRVGIHSHQLIKAPDDRLGEAALSITLKREDRYRRRVSLTTDCGEQFLLDLPVPTYMAHGDGLLLSNGRVVLVRAAEEPLLELRAATSEALAKLAWHIGNRHTPAEITDAALYIQPDHVLADMVRGLGGRVTEVMRAFEPEGGAYGGNGALEKSHHHGEHSHGHAHEGTAGHHSPSVAVK